jgi:1-phosphatidylinositol-3-phosphate 5-kinase
MVEDVFEHTESDSEHSMKVEYNSDREEFTDNDSLPSEADVESNFPESEVYSDSEVAEDESSVDNGDVVDGARLVDDVIDDGSGSVKSEVVDALDDAANDLGEDLTSPDFHIKLQFQNNTAKFYCSVYYAEQFRQLRELIFPEGEERYVHSLSRCMFWKATGGKSGSSFSKSLDDRFVMKQMSRLEVQSFVDFSPRYFTYITKAVKEKRPTALAKLLGVYRIGFKNSDTNTTMRQDVLVMENLFYNKRVSKIYDLKGSVRSRYVQSSTKEDVLMDENLLETICDNPLFIRPHGKAVLSKAIFNDTDFLSTNMVMDYSLLVGVEEKTLKLVVGIIDYIRTYTWDKKLESYVKSTGILGGQGKMPTVVSPDVYRLRFNAAMTQHYFLMVPDKWTGFGEDVT